MAAKKPRVLIIGAGMAGITAANRIHSAAPRAFEIAVVEGGTRIGGRICTAEFGGDRIEMGATWIHGIGGSPVHAIAADIGALDSDQPWECMDGSQDDPTRLVTVAEGGFVPDNQTLVDPISELFNSLMSFVQNNKQPISEFNKEIAVKAFESLSNEKLSVGAFLSKALSLYQAKSIGDDEIIAGDWNRNSLEKALFEVFENTQRTYTSAGDLSTLDYVAESEYRMCSDEEITIGRGYSSVINHLASSLPPGMIRLGKKVETVEWGSNSSSTPVKVRFSDGTSAEADHVVVTVSLGVLKAGAVKFAPALPEFKSEAIARLGFGVVNKLFVKLANSDAAGDFPLLRMAFHKKKKKRNIPNWMRKTASMFPIYDGSSVLLSWFAGAEALALESLGEDEIKEGVSETISAFVGDSTVEEILRSRWGNDPLFLGSYSYVAVGSSGDDLDAMAEPLPKIPASSQKPLQILFAGEATHRTHYSTTHGAYFSGLREGNRLLRHYSCLGL